MGKLYIGSDKVDTIDEIVVENVCLTGDLGLKYYFCEQIKLIQDDVYISISADKIDFVIEALQKAKELWGDK